MNYKNILKVSLAVLAAAALFAGCAKKEFEEITEITLSRCLEPQNLSARVDAATGDNVVFGWDVNKDAQLYLLTVYGDAELTKEVKNWELAPSAVPFLTRLTADEKYWFTVQAFRVDADGFRVEESASKIAVYDSESGIKTYAVKDNLFLEITGVSENSVSLAWSKDVSDFEEVTDLQAVPVKGGKTVKKELSAAEKAAAAATIDGLEASTEYQITLFYLSASRGTKDVWTSPSAGEAVKVNTSDALKSALASGQDVYVEASGSPYEIGSVVIPNGLRMLGGNDEEGNKPIVTGKLQITADFTGDIYIDNIAFDGAGATDRIVDFKSGNADVDKVSFINLDIYNYTCGFFYKQNNAGVLNLGEFVMTGCYVHDILGSGGDGFDIRANTHIEKMTVTNNTFQDGFRDCFRVDAGSSDFPNSNTLGDFEFKNNTVKNVSLINKAFFYIRAPWNSQVISKNLFLWEDDGATEAGKSKALLYFQADLPTSLNGSDNYVYQHSIDWFSKVSAANAGFKVLNQDPCHNSKGNFFQLAIQELIDNEIGDPRWWIPYVEKPEDLTQNVVSAPHVWNLQDASLFAGEVKNSRVRDELLLVGTEQTPLNADGGINFISASVLSRRGMTEEGYAAFKVDGPGSVDILLEDPNKAGGSVVIALVDDNGLNVQGGAAVSSDGVQKILVPKVDGAGIIYIYALGAVSMTKLAWSADTEGGNKVLATPKPVVEPVTVKEGEAVEVTVTWNAIDHAANYVVVFNKKAYEPQIETTFTVSADDIAALKAGLYNFTIQAFPEKETIYYVKSDVGTAALAIQPKGGEEEAQEITLTWDFSDADWQAALADQAPEACNETNSGSNVANWSVTCNGLTYTSGSGNGRWSQTGWIQTNGAGSTSARVFKFTAPAAGKLIVIGSNTGNAAATDGRGIGVTDSTGDLTPIVNPNGAGTDPKEASEWDVAAGEVAVYSSVKGIRFYMIQFVYTENPTEKESYSWVFSDADWQSALADQAPEACNETNSGSNVANWSVTCNGLTYTSGSGNGRWSQTGWIQTNGAGSTSARVFKFTVGKAGILRVVGSNTGNAAATDGRGIGVTDSTGELTPIVNPNGAGTDPKEASEWDVAAGEVAVYSTVKGIRFYSIEFESK